MRFSNRKRLDGHLRFSSLGVKTADENGKMVVVENDREQDDEETL